MLSEYRGYLAVALALLASLTLTPVVRALARRTSKVSRPRADRWARQPTALLGGIAIFAAVAVAAPFVLYAVSGGWLLVGTSTLLFAVGLVDDLRTLKPYQKLLGQLAGCVLMAAFGKTLAWTPWQPLNMAVTLFWLVGITNALNLLDNMDGLATGVAAIAATFLSILFFTNGQPAEGFLLAAFGAALLGFLVYNFNPASIFMGDCGSLFIGFFLASAALLPVEESDPARRLTTAFAVPVLLLAIPIFDTTLVTVVRKLNGRAISQGGRDHSSHRLVALGFSERRAVIILYELAILSGLLALWMRDGRPDISMCLMAMFAAFLTLLGIRLARINVYGETPAAKTTPPADTDRP
jgi:UDP-GlcNAc:undecaprenyl-phosphate GlcNAc-1-phosphate transferase